MLSLSLSAFLFRIWLVLLVHMAMLGLVWHKSKGQTDQNEADFVELLHTSATDYKFFYHCGLFRVWMVGEDHTHS